jgi:glutamate 5-kinase
MMEDLLRNLSGKKILFKIGSEAVNDYSINVLREAVEYLGENNAKSLIVSSGARKLGELELISKGINLQEGMRYKQLACGVGQPFLMQKYSEIFGDLPVSQYLLTCDDLEDSVKKENLLKNIDYCLDLWAIPIINFNDSLADYELKKVQFFSDNDLLSAVVAKETGCDLLIMITNIGGIYDLNNNKLIKECNCIDAHKYVGTEKTHFGTGGMLSKIKACQILGKDVIISSAERLMPVLKMESDECTRLYN